MLINRRKILASIGLLMANSVWPLLSFGQSTYTLVTSESDLVAGNKYIIVGENAGAYKAMGYDKGNNRAAIAIIMSNDSISVECAKLSTGTDSVFEFRLGGNNTDGWLFCDIITGAYLCAASSSSNYLKSKADSTDGNAKWDITIDNGAFSIIAKGNYTRNILRYNSSSSLFACYSSESVRPVFLYKKSEESPTINTTVDTLPPTFSTNYPKTENVTITSFDLKVKANEPCTVYYRVVAEGEPAPTVNDLLASDSTITVATGNTECSATVTGLESETTYNVYLIAKDTADNVQEDSTIISVTTVSAIQKSIALRDIEAKYYWGEMANIKWTATNFDASTDLDSILIFKDNNKILSYPIDITSGEADILIGNGITPNKDTYATNYSLKVVSGNVESERSENFTIVPVVTINQLLTDTTTRGVLNFKDKNVKIKGLVTGSKKQQNPAYKSFTLQDGDSAFCSIFVYYCVDTIVATGDSVFAEGKFNISSNEQYRIGSSTTYTSTATRINSNNNLPAPRATEISVTQIKALMSSLIKIIGVNCDNAKSCFYIGEDTIYYKETLYTGVLNPLDNRKYDVSGVLGRGTGKRYEIWPRSEADIHLYSNDTTLANLVIGGHNVLNSDTLIINNLTITGIAATTNDAMASLSIRVNNNFVSPADWANVTLAPLDSVFVTVTAEDGTAKTYKRIIDCKTLFFSPLVSNAFGTGDTISLSWTSYNISDISLSLDIQNNTIQLTDSAISADLGEWDFVVPDAMFGSGLVKAVRNGVILDSIAVTISDTKAPVVVRQSPANGSDSLANSLYIRIVFDERITVAEGAKLNIGELEFPITAVGDSAAKAFVSGLDFGTEYSVELPAGAIRDLAGNSATLPTWTFTTRNAPQPDLYFSEYAKGSSNNKYYEIYNPCDTAVDLSRYFVTLDNIVGSTRLTTLQLSGVLLPNEVLVVANSSASAEIKKRTDVSNSGTTKFTGDDLLGLFRKDGSDTVLIDVLGPFGNCETAVNWAVAGIADASTNRTIVRKIITCGTADWSESAGADSLDSQWIVLEQQNDLSSLGRHGIGHGTEILRMSIGGKAATVNNADTTVSVEVPYGTDIEHLFTTFRISQGAQMFIGEALATDTIDFSSPVLATVVAGDNINQKNWTIIVTMAPRPSSGANILTFNFVETTPISVSIDTTNATIDAVVAYNLDSLKLTPVITISEKAKVPTTLFRSNRGIFTAKTRWEFDEPQTIAVTAEDLTVKNWTVSVAKEPEPHLTFSPLASNSFGTGDTISLAWTSYNISDISLSLYIQNNTIQLTDSAISADLGEWNFVVPDAMFGNGLVKAVRNGIALDSIAVTISDTKAPVVVRQSPANGSDSLANSLYISMAFDERITVAEGAKLNIGELEFPIIAVGDSAAKAFVSSLDFGTEYSVELPAGAIHDLAGNSATLPTWTFTTRTAPQPDLYFSEYAKGSSNNKYYEIYNPCDTAVDLTRYFVTMDKIAGNQRLTTLQLSGTLPPNEVLVVANSSASAEIKKRTDVSNSGTTKFTGDDLLGLFRKDGSDTVLIDVLGPFANCDVASDWGAAGIADASTNRTITRKLITCGTTDWNESAGTDSLDSQWTVLPQNDLSSIGRHGIGHGTEIFRMSIGGLAATVSSADTTVSVEVPYGTDIEHLFTTFRISQGAQMFIGEALTTDTIDFSSPVLATIAAGDGINQKVWTITVTMEPRPSSDANILTFNFVETSPISVSIDTTNATIDAAVAYNLDSLKLTSVITISEKAKVPTTLFKSSRGIFTAKTRWDFDEPQTIAVTAEDLTVKNWTVSVAKEPEPHLTFSPLTSNSFGTGDTISLSWTSYNISDISLSLDIQNNTIQLTDSAISADLGVWIFVVPDAIFGSGLVKAVRNGVVLDSIDVIISDTKAPMVVRQSPANGSDSLANSLYISMAFDEKVVVTDGANLNVGNVEAAIIAVNDTMVKAFVCGLDFETEYSVELPAGAVKDLAGNSAILPTLTFTTRTAPQPDLYFSEYAKGSSNNKYYEIYNPCDTAVDLTRYFVTMDKIAGNQRLTTLQLSGTLPPNEVLVVANSSASAEIKKRTDVSNSGTTKFTGDDLLGLFRKDGNDTVLIDVLGPFGECDVAANWVVAGDNNASSGKTIVRKLIICGTADWNESAGTDSLDSQWIVLELQNDLSSLGRHGIGHGTEIMRMSIGGKAATVNSADTTVSVEVPYGTDLTKLAVSYRISQGAQMFINGSLAADTIDFSSPVLATVVAGDNINQKNWTIIVTMAPRPSSDANILTFNFVETTPISISIDTTNATINAVVAYNIDSLKLTPVITISEKAKVSTTLFRSSRGIFTAKNRWDFDEPQNIAVTAEDLTVKNWTVSVAKEPEPHLTFSPLASNSFGTGDTISLSWTSYNISNISLSLDIQNNTIQLTDSAISADLGEWNFVVPDAMFGNGLVKAVRNGVVLDSIAVTISDTKAPMVVRQSPANGSDSLANSLYISMVFDERITVAEGAKLNIGELEFPIIAVGDSAAKAFVSDLDFETEYSVELPAGALKDLAGNSATLPTWTFTTRTAPQPDLYFSEYAKGSSNNKYYEIYNPCDTAVDLSRYFVTMDAFSSNGSRSQATLQLSGWLMPNEVLVVANSSAATAIKQNADVSTTKTTTFTGDDLLGLFRKDGSDTVLIDVLGPFGECDAANYWSAAGVEKVSTDHTIVRNVIICGTTYWNESAGTDSLDSQWTVLGKDDWSNLGMHGNGHNVEILRMSIGGIAATIDRSEATISAEVPYGTDLTKLAVSYRISQGAQMFINDSLATDTVDLSQPVTATVIAGDSVNQKVWTIIVTMASKPSSEANILTFNFVETAPISVSIDTANATIDAVVAYNLDSLKLTPVITIAEMASVSSTLFKSSKRVFTAKTKWDFNEPKTITVTAEDLTMKNWTVSVAKEPEPHLSFSPLATNSFGTGETINLSWTSYNISKISFALDIQNNTIQLTDSAINADLGAWNFVVPDAVFGNGWVKAVRNGIAIDSIAVSIADTKAPVVVRQSPANGSDSLANSLYISMAFDERITVAEGAKLNIGELEFPITAVGDSAAKAFVCGLDYNTLHNISISEGSICDLAGNSAILPTWTFTTRTAPQPDLYFSEYAKGSSNNKYYEIYNPCDTAVDLSRYFVTLDEFTSSSRKQTSLQLSGWLLPNEVLVVANGSASAEIKKRTDVSNSGTTKFTGDDLLGLFRKDGSDTVLIDVLGPFGECDAANYWSAAGVEKVSTDHTIVRNVIICGTTYWNESAGTDSLDSQWTVLGKDDWSNLGMHGNGHNVEILRMSIGGIAATIDRSEATISAEVPYGTDLTKLAVSYRISQGAQMFINDSLATDTVDLSQPVTATVIAGDSVNQKVWTIIVTMAPKPSSDNNILTFSFVETAPISVTIDTANATIDAIMAYNPDSLKLTPVITIAEFASVSSTLFKSSKRVFTAKTKWNFNEPQTIKVTAEDLTEKVWSVRVDWEKSKELTIKDIAKLDGGLMANIGKPISTEGIVTHIVITSKGAEIHIQDSTGMWSGIMVFDEGKLYAANVAVGDRIKVSGVIAENFGMACIEQIEALAITSSDNRILTDTIIVEDALSTAYQNAIVTIDSVVCTGGFENLFAVSDSTNSILIYNKYRISDFALEIDSMYRITGIVYYTSADNSYRIIPRSADDIVKLVRPQKPEQSKPEEQKPEEQKPQEPDTTTVGISGTHIGLTAYTIGRTIVVENAGATVTVFDIAGRLIATARPARRIAISAPHSGIYIVGTRQGAIKVRVD